jgi:predicted enzyme related to lactoylglutathione lyase
MPDSPSRFVWYELLTTDPAGAKAFYGDVAGWTTQDAPMPGMTYTLINAGEQQIAGLMATPQELLDMGVPPCWTGYVGVADVDTAAEEVQRLGGQVRRAPEDIPGVGRFAIVADPQGAVIALFHSDQGAAPWAEPGTPGHFGWHELYTDDVEKGFAFYSALFGWRKDQAMEMGDMGVYQLFAIGERVCGGMMAKPPGFPVSAWIYYINVGDIDAAVARVKAGGGSVHNGPEAVPTGQWIAQGQDPQGAWFALLGHRAG